MDISEKPICVSQFFVNKLNLRSYGTLVKFNILKLAPEKFSTVLLGDLWTTEIPADFQHILNTIQVNLRNKSKQNFKEYFQEEGSLYLQPVSKEYIFNSCWKALCEIIPGIFFSCNKNTRIFKNLIHSSIYSMRRQHLLLNRVLQNWDTSVLLWKDLPNSKEIIYHIVLWMLKYILAPIICLNFYVTTCKLEANENKLFYFYKHHWQSFHDKQIFKMVFTKVIKKSIPYSIGKKIRKTHNCTKELKLKTEIKNIPKLHFILKPNHDCRPIVHYKSNSQSNSEKYKIRDRLKFLKSLITNSIPKIEITYNTLYDSWIKANKPKLYFVKTDLSNAFGSINRELLLIILADRYTNLIKRELCVSKKIRITKQYKDIVTELHKPILIRTGSTVYEWKAGLVQGYKYSPALSEIYYSYLDKKYLSNHLYVDKNSVKLFTRVVDDYLYITDSLDDAKAFLDALSNYKNVNYAKTVVNFSHDHIRFSNQIIFLGYCYNVATLQVSRASNVFAGPMCYKIAFTVGISDLQKFIESRIGQSGIQISSHIFNLQYNNEEMLWNHIFTTYCLSANKFCTISAILCDEREMNDMVQIYKKRVTVKLTILILETINRRKHSSLSFVYCINHFRYLSWKALSLCAKSTPKCSGLMPLVYNELAKSNCIFGKWKVHASRIAINGETQLKAVREVCHRTDLRHIFRRFDSLPPEFECYHQRRLD